MDAEKDDLRRWRNLSYLFGRFSPRHSRQVQIEDDHVWSQGRYLGEGAFAVHRFPTHMLILPLFQRSPQAHPHNVMVVD